MSNNIFNVEKIRLDFPALHQKVHGYDLVYLDNAATSLRPKNVIDAVSDYYTYDSANIHRAVHTLSERATEKFEKARDIVQHFIKAKKREEIIFTKGATEAINLVASSYGRKNLSVGDEVVVSTMEHHSNIVPWQLIAGEKGAVVKPIKLTSEGDIDLDHYKELLLSSKVKIVALTAISNAIGTINPIKQMIKMAHEIGAKVLIDAAQAVCHEELDVVLLDCDFLVFSGHKVFAPTGIGVLYGKEELLKEMPPYQGGGDMIKSVSFERTTFNDLPYKFEAGTPPISEAIGLGAALNYLSAIGLQNVFTYEKELLLYATRELSTIEDLTIIGKSKQKSSIISFVLKSVHPHDIGTMVDQKGVAIRTGHHCAFPVMKFYGVAATARASLAFYNTKSEILKLKEAILATLEFFR